MAPDKRQAGAEVEVTEEMIEAGLRVFMGHEITEGDENTWKNAIRETYSSMFKLAARKVSLNKRIWFLVFIKAFHLKLFKIFVVYLFRHKFSRIRSVDHELICSSLWLFPLDFGGMP